MLAFGEVQTGLLQHSTPLSRERTGEILDLVMGERVRLSDRPIAYALSPDRLHGVDCPLPTVPGSRTRAVGTVVAHATIVGGHVAQGSSYARVTASSTTRRLAWSHYLANPGRIETIGRFRQPALVAGVLNPAEGSPALDVGAVAGRMLDTVQRSPLLDHRPAVRAPRVRLRWVAELDQSEMSGTYTIDADDFRTLHITTPGDDLASVVALCEDLALHDWLLTTLVSLLDSTLTSHRSRAQKIARLQPAVDHLLHLWMPAARVADHLAPMWEALEHRPGFSRQWEASVTRVRDQLTMSALTMLRPSGGYVDQPTGTGATVTPRRAPAGQTT
ncbi:SCO2521 family protein [Actinoplanes utahensis]|uniref:SCO2521 family protein n=1 Tax=Actinoplanes utahensis TaxID=1869 RepID=UPI00068CCF14|nr:SCO2521 family protein [Actinoplanes utahensis]GIF34283.1 hypothetical protein Aut01nite_72690 [Actinoplanes utahensis]